MQLYNSYTKTLSIPTNVLDSVWPIPDTGYSLDQKLFDLVLYNLGSDYQSVTPSNEYAAEYWISEGVTYLINSTRYKNDTKRDV